MSKWNNYRMWRKAVNAVTNSGWTSDWLSEWRPTGHIFRARSQSEAQKKADKFWRECQFGAGSMLCVLEGEQPHE